MQLCIIYCVFVSTHVVAQTVSVPSLPGVASREESRLNFINEVKKSPVLQSRTYREGICLLARGKNVNRGPSTFLFPEKLDLTCHPNVCCNTLLYTFL